MKVKKIINKLDNFENIRISNQHGELIWEGYVLDLKGGYPFDMESYFIFNSKVLGLRTKKIKMDNLEQNVVLDIFIKKGDKK